MGLIIDSFAGGGGTSTGIEMAGYHVDIAINHDPAAIAMHKANHPTTRHYCESVWDVDPREACKGQEVSLAWFSPDCKHFSKAKGAALVDRSIRGLAWIVLRWAGTVKPKVIILENVEEFVTWGPVRKGKPVKKRIGETFERWLSQLRSLGYTAEYRELTACDYGAPTSRRRFYLVARCDGEAVVWPKPTHGAPDTLQTAARQLKPWRTAADIIDWSLPCPSIFASKAEIMEMYGLKAQRPLKDNTLRRIIRGVDKFTLNGTPYIVQGNAASLIQYHSEQSERVRGQSLEQPLMTVDARPRYGLTVAHICKYKGKDKGQSPRTPLQTITATQGGYAVIKISASQTDMGHWPKVREMLNRYCGYSLGEDDVIVIYVDGTPYYIADIGLRMLTPREAFNAQGFPRDYIIDTDADGKPYPKSAQMARCGNAVCPPVAAALVAANTSNLVKLAQEET